MSYSMCTAVLERMQPRARRKKHCMQNCQASHDSLTLHKAARANESGMRHLRSAMTGLRLGPCEVMLSASQVEMS